MGRIKYSEFVDRLDMDALEEELEFTVLYEDGKGNDVGYCLFPENHSHGDTTGKFAIHRDLKVYNCFVCGGGSLLSLVMELKHCDWETAEDFLRPFAVGDRRADSEFTNDFLQAFAKDVQQRGEALPYFNSRVLDQWPLAMDYDHEMNLNYETLEKYNVRYAKSMFKPRPKSAKFENDEDYYGPAYIFPHTWNDQLVGWQCRWLEEDRPKWVPKWTNTGDFPRDDTLYGWDQRISAKFMVVVESARSVHKLADDNLPAVGTFGDSVSDQQLRLLRRFQEVWLWPDNDKSGWKWLNHLYDYLDRYVKVKFIQPVYGLKSDAADLSTQGGIHYQYVCNNLIDSVEMNPQELKWAAT